MTITVPQKAWFAGALETRGKIRFTNNPERRTNQLVLQVRSTHLKLIDRLAELTGTKAGVAQAKEIRSSNRRPCIEHCTEKHSHVIAEIGEHAIWQITGCGAAIVLDNLMPYFVSPEGLQAVADNLIEGLPKDGRGRQAVDQTIVRLKKLGWWIPPAALVGFIGFPEKETVAA